MFLYENIELLPYEDMGDSVCFEFVKGTRIDADIDYVNEPVEIIVEKIKNVLHKIENYHQKYVEDFELSDGFENMFPGCNPGKVKAVKKSIDIFTAFFLPP